ncbi:hypothetical protein B0H14DRAFT_2332474 [Mycena olivaceomarginata]|nr:hypothetical protein B0H14DRAFT_2332474 [Mycena olivaceomarginata]
MHTHPLTFMLHSPYNSSILHSLISSCPNLQHLQLSCIHKTSFQLEVLSKSLPAFRCLCTFSLTLVSAGDLSFAATGMCIARENPCLISFTLVFVPHSYLHALPQRPLYHFPCTKKASTPFMVVLNVYRLPLVLHVCESDTTVWPWGLRVTRHVWQYMLDLCPPGAFQRGTGVHGMLVILLESSAAGEMRMFMFCSLLVCFAGTFVVKG